MPLSSIEIINGTLSLIFVIISIIVGLIIVSKYFKLREKIFIFVGLVWIGITMPYWSVSTSFLVALITDKPLSLEIYLFIAIFFLPIFFFIWWIAFTDLICKEKKKIILILYSIEALIFEIFFLYYLFTNPSIMGELESPVNMRYLSFVRIWTIIHAIIFLLTGLLFARGTIKIGNPEMKLKGIFIAIAFVSYFIGVTLDILFPVGFVLNRIILMSSAVEFYFGFILPNWMKKLLLKEK